MAGMVEQSAASGREFSAAPEVHRRVISAALTRLTAGGSARPLCHHPAFLIAKVSSRSPYKLLKTQAILFSNRQSLVPLL